MEKQEFNMFVCNIHLYILKPGGLTMGWYGNCTDCLYYEKIYKCDGRDEYRCGESGIYFDSMYGGDKCSYYVNRDEYYEEEERVRKEREEEERKRNEEDDEDNSYYVEKKKSREHSGFDKFWGCIMGICMIFGTVVSIFDSVNTNKRTTFKKVIENNIYQKSWNTDGNDVPYLDVFIKPPVFLSKETVCRDAYNLVTSHNNTTYRYKKRETLDDVKRATKLYAYYVENFPAQNGMKQDGIVVLSSNADSNFAKEVRHIGALLIENGQFATAAKKVEIEAKRIPEVKIASTAPGKWEKANVTKYTLSAATGADEMWNIGTKVVLDDHGYVTCYSNDFESWDNRKFDGLNVSNRIVTVLDNRITKYNGSARLTEKIVLSKGIRIGEKTIYEIRKGYKIYVRDRNGDKYLCNIPFRGKKSINVYLKEKQFKVSSKRNWYRIRVPQIGKEMWVDGRNLRRLM